MDEEVQAKVDDGHDQGQAQVGVDVRWGHSLLQNALKVVVGQAHTLAVEGDCRLMVEEDCSYVVEEDCT